MVNTGRLKDKWCSVPISIFYSHCVFILRTGKELLKRKDCDNVAPKSNYYHAHTDSDTKQGDSRQLNTLHTTDIGCEMEDFKVYAPTTGKSLRRSLSFVSISSEDDSEQFDFRRRVHTSATSLDKPKQRIRPRPYYSGSSKKKERALKDGFVWMQIVPHKKKSWQLRYFMIFKEKLCYLEEPVTNNSNGIEWKEIRPCDIVSVKIPNDILLFHSNQSSYMVSLKTNSRISRTKILLRFKSQEERDEWITAFLMAKSWSLLDEKKE